MSESLSELGFEFFDKADSGTQILEIGERYGGVYKVPTMPLVQMLSPRSKESTPRNTYSGLFGFNEFPYHTDMAHWHRPPRFIVMRCVVPNGGVATRLLSAKAVLPDYRSSSAKRALFKPRRRLDGKLYFLRVSESELFRWDSTFIQPANRAATALKSDIEYRLRSMRAHEIRFTKSGQVLIIDNWSMLHGRSVVEISSPLRSIERIYLKSVNL